MSGVRVRLEVHDDLFVDEEIPVDTAIDLLCTWLPHEEVQFASLVASQLVVGINRMIDRDGYASYVLLDGVDLNGYSREKLHQLAMVARLFLTRRIKRDVEMRVRLLRTDGPLGQAMLTTFDTQLTDKLSEPPYAPSVELLDRTTDTSALDAHKRRRYDATKRAAAGQ